VSVVDRIMWLLKLNSHLCKLCTIHLTTSMKYFFRAALHQQLKDQIRILSTGFLWSIFHWSRTDRQWTVPMWSRGWHVSMVTECKQKRPPPASDDRQSERAHQTQLSRHCSDECSPVPAGNIATW